MGLSKNAEPRREQVAVAAKDTADHEEQLHHGTKRERTIGEEPRAAKRRKEQQSAKAATASPEPRKETENGSEPQKRYGVPEQLRRSQLTVRGKSTPPLRSDDKEGHYVCMLGEGLTKRFKVLNRLGEGTFGRVLECWDRHKREYVAVKVVRNVPKYREAAMIELEVLNTINRHDPSGSRHCVRLRDWFEYREHVCMVFERLGPSLYDFLRKNGYKPFSAGVVREVGQQLLESVAFLHGLGLVHTDLKPENILLTSGEYDKASPPPDSRVGRRVPLSSSIQVIDFGSATYDDQYHSSIVSTRHYRAPEVMLGVGWSYPCDIWSVGCILVELLSGDVLFQTHDNLEHLAMMEAMLGPLPPSMVQRAKAAGQGRYFQRDRLNWPDGADGRKSIRAVRKMVELRETLREKADTGLRPYLADALDLLHKLLAYEPKERLTAHEALQHSFFTAAARTASPGAKAVKTKGNSSSSIKPAPVVITEVVDDAPTTVAVAAGNRESIGRGEGAVAAGDRQEGSVDEAAEAAAVGVAAGSKGGSVAGRTGSREGSGQPACEKEGSAAACGAAGNGGDGGDGVRREREDSAFAERA